ncbi:MAG: FMN-binding protein [Candidatus Omnitrophica bacterium]|nr:FMN-binding protein [Candidatus Omnitrophota bacterium]
MNNNILRFSLILFLVNFVAASILVSVYYITKPRIELQQRMMEEESLEQVMPESVGDRLEPVKEDGEIKCWKVFKGPGSRVRGYVFIAKKYGYSSVVETMVGINNDGTITGIRILNQNETPGLGAKIVEVVSNKTLLKALKGIFSREKESEGKLLPYFTEQFKGRHIRRLELSNGNIQAITGATISSKAVAESIKEKGLEILGRYE